MSELPENGKELTPRTIWPERDVDLNYANLPPELRREYLAYRLMGSPIKLTGKALAKELGLAASTISYDLSTPEFMETCREIMLRFVKSNLMAYAIKNISKDIIERGNVKTSMWLVEKSQFLIEETLNANEGQSLNRARQLINEDEEVD